MPDDVVLELAALLAGSAPVFASLVRRQVVSLPLVAAVEDHVAHLALPIAHRLKQIMIKKVNVEKKQNDQLEADKK